MSSATPLQMTTRRLRFVVMAGLVPWLGISLSMSLGCRFLRDPFERGCSRFARLPALLKGDLLESRRRRFRFGANPTEQFDHGNEHVLGGRLQCSGKLRDER